MCYNVLCDKYCTRQQYGYCPVWALSWEYRKKSILEDIKALNADIISLQVSALCVYVCVCVCVCVSRARMCAYVFASTCMYYVCVCVCLCVCVYEC